MKELCFSLIIVPLVVSYPAEMSAPISEIHWNYRGNWGSIFNEVDFMPKSFHTQYMKSSNDRTDDDTHIIKYTINHPQFHPKSKSLHISLDPKLGDSKLSFKDTFLDAVQAFTTVAPKRNPTTKRPKKPTNKLPSYDNKPRPKPNKEVKQADDTTIDEVQRPTSQPTTSLSPQRPNNNNLAGQSQIGNRESQMVIKPTVIVNIRGTVSNTDSDIKVESRADDEQTDNENGTSAQNIFNINQSVQVENNWSLTDDEASAPIKKQKSIDNEQRENDDDKQSREVKFSEKLSIETREPKKTYIINIGPLGGFVNF